LRSATLGRATLGRARSRRVPRTSWHHDLLVHDLQDST
jgi:hypothetical protein